MDILILHRKKNQVGIQKQKVEEKHIRRQPIGKRQNKTNYSPHSIQKTLRIETCQGESFNNIFETCYYSMTSYMSGTVQLKTELCEGHLTLNVNLSNNTK